MHEVLVRAKNLFESGKYNEAGQMLMGLLEVLEVTKEFDENRTDDNLAAVYHLLGMVCHRVGYNDKAKRYLAKAVRHSSDPTDPLNNFAAVCVTLKDFGQAAEALRWIQDNTPDSKNVLINVGLLSMGLKKYEKAKTLFTLAREKYPDDSADAMHNLGNLMCEQEKFASAIGYFRTAYGEGYKPAGLNLADCELRLGRWREGWKSYEARWHSPRYEKVWKRYKEPHWVRGDINGKTLKLYCEQGYGDVFQYLRYAKFIHEEMGVNIIFDGDENLMSLLREQSYISDIKDADFCQSICSLPYILSSMGYPSDPLFYAQVYIDGGKDEPKKGNIGVCWKTESSHPSSKTKSCDYMFFDHLRKNYQVSSLQIGPPALNLNNPDISTFQKTAKVIQSMECVVTIDTSIAHLAGAIGKKTYLMLPFRADWRWGTDRSHPVWYENMTIFRQHARGKWEMAFERLYNLLGV